MGIFLQFGPIPLGIQWVWKILSTLPPKLFSLSFVSSIFFLSLPFSSHLSYTSFSLITFIIICSLIRLYYFFSLPSLSSLLFFSLFFLSSFSHPLYNFFSVFPLTSISLASHSNLFSLSTISIPFFSFLSLLFFFISIHYKFCSYHFFPSHSSFYIFSFTITFSHLFLIAFSFFSLLALILSSYYIL